MKLDYLERTQKFSAVFKLFFLVFNERRRYQRLFYLAIFFVFFNVLYNCCIPLLISASLDALLVDHNTHRLMVLAFIQLGAFLALLYTDFNQAAITAKIGVILTQWLRFKMFAHLQNIIFSTKVFNPEAQYLTNFTQDLEQFEFTISHNLWSCVRAVAVILPATLILFYLNIQLSAVIIFIPVAFLVPRFLQRKAAEFSVLQKENASHLSAMVQEGIALQDAIRLFVLKSYKRRLFKNIMKRMYDTKVKYHTYADLTGRAAYLTLWIAKLLVLGFGAIFVLHKRMSIGQLIGFTEVFAIINGAVGSVSNSYANLIQGGLCFENIEKYFSTEIIAPTKTQKKMFIGLHKAIEFKQVNFVIEGKIILDNINFSIKANQFVAFVGQSGAGKSTLLKMLLKEIEPTTGKILVDGIDLQEIQTQDLYAHIGIVMQDAKLFNASIKENILIGKRDASQSEIVEAATLAEIHQDILGFDEQYATHVGHLQNKISGGQAKRIAIARALIRKPSILFFDEATSSLDPINSAAIDETCNKLTGFSTIISITHRLNSVVHADNIIVMNKGRVVETGTHATLLNNKNYYHDLWDKQHGFEVSVDNRYVHITASWLKQRVPLFQKIEIPLLESLAQAFSVETYEPHEILIEQGELGHKFYIVASGIVEVTRQLEHRPQFVARLTDGDFFGEVALLNHTPRNARVTAVGSCILLVLTSQHFYRIYETLSESTKIALKNIAAERDI